MLTVLLSVLIVSSVSAGLALVLVVADRFVANYGECTITINEQKKLKVQGGKNVLAALTEEKLFIPSACGGRGTCGYCKVRATEGAGPVLPTETPFLTPKEIEDNVRLSCQIKIRNDLKIEIPEELLAVKEYEAVCSRITDLTYDMKHFHFELRDPPTIDFVPGQYIQLLCPQYKGNREEVYRAYSVASDPADKTIIDLIIRRVPNGICTTWCFDFLKEGDTVRFNGPYGEFRLSQTDAPMIWVAGASGMAPFVSLLYQMRNERITRPTTYFFGGNKVKDMFYLDRMRAFEKELPNFRFVPVVAAPDEGEQWDGERGLVTQALERADADLSGHEGYLCGSPGMIDAAIKVMNQLGIPNERIFYDKFE
ncbi:MAG TPA: 2Fe-2S iron-sulfur cluster binding domain-containing protein [Anaerohalosphaeraceae bacterium]|nr:2Fe-2S iron-sulfur cluster binding domain-containing protein [Anaerohalosphaeraceae bacterium]HRT49714.1 2Fe-2S iron-sulfur cluster binding domain-containing protein [Anaerohalosphaeraceae bacterium]HRT87650.1 2Fe-2S iron-sulfur cluster binding domain-containing protein [Anaerohalosphaeraceae bacterium]